MKFLEVLGKLAAVFSKPLSKAGLSEYFEALKMFDIRPIERACVQFRNTATRFPLPVDFRRELSSYIQPDNPPGLTMADMQNTASFRDWRKRCASKCNRCGGGITVKALAFSRWVRLDYLICPGCVRKEQNAAV